VSHPIPTEVETRLTDYAVSIELPWPDPRLSPNARVYHFERARAAKADRKVAWGLTLKALKGWTPPWQSVALHWDFHPKTRNLPDGDNAQSACKAFRDGIADALGIDDSKFTTTYSISEPVKGGAVIVTVRSA
jgi:crossover junction endodeoxyribonuclease RusA